MTFHGYRWAGWLVAGTFYLFDVFLRLTCDVITSQLQADFNLSADAVSAAFASSFFYGYAAMQIPVGILLDKLGARYTIILASLLSCVGCLLFSFAETIVVGTIARVISGIGCGCGCIFYDAVIQQCTGFVLSYMWNGQKNKKNEPIYDAPSFSAAFLVLGGSFMIASIMSSLASCRSKR